MSHILLFVSARNRQRLLTAFSAGQFPVAHDVLPGLGDGDQARVQWSVPHATDPYDLYMIEQTYRWDGSQVLACNCKRGDQIGLYRPGRKQLPCAHRLLVLFFALPEGVRQHMLDADFELALAFHKGRAIVAEAHAQDRDYANEYAGIPF